MSFFYSKSSNKEANVQKFETSVKDAWTNLIGVDAQAEFDRSGFKFNLNATAWVSHSGCKISTTTTGGATESTGLPVPCQDIIEMARTVRSTEQPGRTEIALLVPYR